MWTDASHTCADDSQFFMRRGNFGLQPVSMCFQRAAVLNEHLSTGEHCDGHDTGDIQHGVTNGLGPALWQGQGLNIIFVLVVAHGVAQWPPKNSIVVVRRPHARFNLDVKVSCDGRTPTRPFA